MVSALLYLQGRSFVNRTASRLKRLKQPKYLLGGIVGAAYFYFYFFRQAFGARRGSGPGILVSASPENLALYELLGAAVLLVLALMAWLIPRERAALAFTEAEVAFLFPAPISRRGLIHFKLLRSQAAILFTTLILTLVFNRLGPHAWIRAAGWWLVLSTLNLHFLGSSFARTLLLDRGISNWQRRLATLAILAGLAVAIVIWARQNMPGFEFSKSSLAEIKDYLLRLSRSGPVPYALFPFQLVVRPYLARDAAAFLQALGPAAGILALHYLWVVRSNVAFEEASVEASRKLAEKIAAVRSGNWNATRQKAKARRAPFRLTPAGAAFVGLLWKNLISAGQTFSSLRLWIGLAAVAAGGSLAMAQGSGGSNTLSVVGMIALMLSVWGLLLGPQLFRQDFREDLPRMDVLKMYPLRGWQIALGESLAPTLILSSFQLCLGVIVAAFLMKTQGAGFGRATALCGALGALPLLPLITLIMLQIPNASVLLFPAWFQSGKEGTHGIEATGQRIILMIGQLLVMVVTLLPAGATFAVVFFLARLTMVVPGALLLGMLAASLVLAVEAAFGVILLGKLFERFDVSSELSP